MAVRLLEPVFRSDGYVVDLETCCLRRNLVGGWAATQVRVFPKAEGNATYLAFFHHVEAVERVVDRYVAHGGQVIPNAVEAGARVTLHLGCREIAGGVEECPRRLPDDDEGRQAFIETIRRLTERSEALFLDGSSQLDRLFERLLPGPDVVRRAIVAGLLGREHEIPGLLDAQVARVQASNPASAPTILERLAAFRTWVATVDWEAVRGTAG